MKKLIALISAIGCVLAFVGCNSPKKFNVPNENNNESLPLTCYTAQQQSWANPDLQITTEQAEFIIDVWNNSVWENSITKTVYDYVFRGDNIEVRYCYDEGIFDDVINNKHVILSEDIREQVNKTVDKFIVLPTIN